MMSVCVHILCYMSRIKYLNLSFVLSTLQYCNIFTSTVVVRRMYTALSPNLVQASNMLIILCQCIVTGTSICYECNLSFGDISPRCLSSSSSILPAELTPARSHMSVRSNGWRQKGVVCCCDLH